MDKHFPISSFDAVYLIDLCEPLLQVARKRFAEKGWSNVTVLCQDASEFSLPEWCDGKDPKGSVGFVTLSYSLSMVSPFFRCPVCVSQHYVNRFRISMRFSTVLIIFSHLKTDSSV